ncbi:MAG: hypothetical protein ACW98Y_15325 [Candidatus Thorarchaeota archaeon]|jgi:hypothetical protein
MTPPIDTEHQENLANDLKKKGYLLELEVYNEFHDRGWRIEWDVPYWDISDPQLAVNAILHQQRSEEKKRRITIPELKSPTETIRTIDFIADYDIELELEHYKKFRISLVTECKFRSKENWIFHLEDISNLYADIDECSGCTVSEDSLDWLYVETGDDEGFHSDEGNRMREASHHSWKNISKVAISGVNAFGSNNSNSVTNSLNQVLNAHIWKINYIYYLFQDYKDRKGLNWRVYPVLIFDGPLYEINIVNGEPEFYPLDWIPVLFNRHGWRYLIDVVSWPKIGKYLDILNCEIADISAIS